MAAANVCEIEGSQTIVADGGMKTLKTFVASSPVVVPMLTSWNVGP